MKHGLMILTLCVTLLGATNAMSFTDITSAEFQGNEYSVVAWGDVDANGYPDLFLGVAGGGQSRLYLGNGTSWVNASNDYEVTAINHVQSARFVDFDQDGNLDLFCLTGDEEGTELYRQTSNQRFQRVALNLEGNTDEGIRSAAWCDADNDGSLDLFLSNRSGVIDESVLLVQSTDEFVEVRGADGPFADSYVNQISPVDFDQDGDLDYFLSKLDGNTSLWSPVQNRFRNYGDAMGFPTKIAQTGITWADFNGDGNLDFYACGSANNSCLYYQYAGENGEPCSFRDMSDEFNLRNVTKNVTSAHAVDVNCDGMMDLFLVRDTGNLLLIGRGRHGWQPLDRGNELTQANRDMRSCAWADLDNDGDLDVAMAQGRFGIKLLRNDAEIDREFISLKLCGSNQSTTPALNCLVEVEFPYGKQWAATSMYASSIGADDQTKIIYNPSFLHSEEWTVNVLWPNGMITSLTENEVALNSVVELHMPIGPSPDNRGFAINPTTIPEVANYPNPFNPTTNIEFNLSETAEISLSIHNLLGQEIAVLASGTYEAGLHSLTFDAAALPSGLYLARLKAPSGSVVHRMLLTK